MQSLLQNLFPSVPPWSHVNSLSKIKKIIKIFKKRYYYIEDESASVQTWCCYYYSLPFANGLILFMFFIVLFFLLLSSSSCCAFLFPPLSSSTSLFLFPSPSSSSSLSNDGYWASLSICFYLVVGGGLEGVVFSFKDNLKSITYLKLYNLKRRQEPNGENK